MEFNINEFIASINQDATKSSEPKDRLHKLIMNAEDNQGSITFLPVISKESNNFYLKIPFVKEFKATSSLIEGKEGWYKVLPLEYYQNLTPDQLELFNEVNGMLDLINDEEYCDFTQFRRRTYNLINGICIEKKDISGKVNPDLNDCACLMIYPVNTVVSEMQQTLNNKINMMKGNVAWVGKIISPNLTGRGGAIQISFVRKSGGQIGYDCSVSLELNNEYSEIVSPNYEIPQELANKFDGVIQEFLGWNYNYAGKSYFNEIAFRELRDHLKLVIKAASGEVSVAPISQTESFENKNLSAPTQNSMPF